MTTYPLEYYLCLKGTPHIKIVDWNAEGSENSLGDGLLLQIVRGCFRCDLILGATNGAHLTNKKEVKLADANSDDHLLLVLRFGERDWIELGEDEALAMMHGELTS